VKRRLLVLLSLPLVASCSTSGSAPAPTAGSQQLTPTPTNQQRVNPDLVEDTPTYTITRYRKSQYIRVDDRHIKSPVVPLTVEFFKEDDEYYYVYGAKPVREPEQKAAQAQASAAATPAPGAKPTPTPAATAASEDQNYGMPPEDFEDVTPPRVAGAFRLEPVAGSGLPDHGMWRHSFVIADMNGDGIPDIVAAPPRLGGESQVHIWLGDGHGKFTRQSLTFTEAGQAKPNTAVAYGGVAVGDIDGDGKLDIVSAGHVGGLTAFFGRGDGKYELVRKGLPGRDFSSQAVVLADVNGDHKLDVVASSDSFQTGTKGSWGQHQLRVFLYDGKGGFTYAPDALIDGAFSNCLSTFDYNGDGLVDVVSGSQAYSAVQILWKNEGNGKFATGFFKEIEIHGFHFATAPGTYGKERLAAFADAFTRARTVPTKMQAQGVSVYSYKDGAWTRHRIWRKKDGGSFMYALAMGDLDGDGLDDVVFPDSDQGRLRIFLQRADGTFAEAEEAQEPKLGSIGQCVRLADVDRDGRLDIVLARTYSGAAPGDKGGWTVYLNKGKS